MGPHRVHGEDEGEGGKLIFHKWRLLLASDSHGSGNRGWGVGGESQETKVSQQKKKKKSCWENVSSLDAISLELQVAGEQGGNAFSVCAGRAERILREMRIPMQRCVGVVIYTSNLSKQWLRVELSARTLCWWGTYIRAGEPRHAGQTQLLITAPALIHLSRRQFGRWTLFTAEAV